MVLFIVMTLSILATVGVIALYYAILWCQHQEWLSKHPRPEHNDNVVYYGID